MDIQRKIDEINSSSNRITYWKEIEEITNGYINSGEYSENCLENLFDCLNSIRYSRFVDSDIDIKLLDLNFKVAKLIKNNKTQLKIILNDMLYYSDYIPEKYIKLEIEKELENLL